MGNDSGGGSLTALITNDDGIDSPGLLHLAQAVVEAGLNVVVAAPASEFSGSSASITATEEDGRILFERRSLDGLDGVSAYVVQAAPALITLLAAHGTFGTAPDLVLSGINRGANIGRAILHSGTVGAALTGGVNGGKAMAVSLDVPLGTEPSGWAVAGTGRGPGAVSRIRGQGRGGSRQRRVPSRRRLRHPDGHPLRGRRHLAAAGGRCKGHNG